jgi:hypothetical protein
MLPNAAPMPAASATQRIEPDAMLAPDSPDSPDSPVSLPLRGGASTAGHAISPAARLCAFALLAVLLFLGAREVGYRLGPIGTAHARSVVTPSERSNGGMNMSAGGLRAGRSAEWAR